MNPYYHHQTPTIHAHQPRNSVYSFPASQHHGDWNYDPMIGGWSTGTLRYAVLNRQPPVEYVDETVILNTPNFTYGHVHPQPLVAVDQQPVYSYTPIQPENTFLDPYGGTPFPHLHPIPYTPFEAYLENNLLRIEQEETIVFEGSIHTSSGLSEETITRSIEQEETIVFEGEVNNRIRTGSGLSEETITRHLQASVEREKMCQDRNRKGDQEESDICAICLDECDGCKKMARLECGHGYHEGCIKTWLLRKNVCPMCKATALKI